MKRVLIITYYWPPTAGSGVQRWLKFSKYLSRFGWECVIYTPENPDQLAVDASLLTDIPEGLEVIKRPIREPYGFYRKVVKSSGKGAGVNQLNAQKKTLLQQLAVMPAGSARQSVSLRHTSRTIPSIRWSPPVRLTPCTSSVLASNAAPECAGWPISATPGRRYSTSSI